MGKCLLLTSTPLPLPAHTLLQITDLVSGADKITLREDPREGVYVDGLSWHAVDSGEGADGPGCWAGRQQQCIRTDCWQGSEGAGSLPGLASQSLPLPSPLPAAEAVLRLLARGAASRHTAATRVNDTSSRSHMVRGGGEGPTARTHRNCCGLQPKLLPMRMAQ